MSLTSLVSTKNPVRDRMIGWFPKPKFELDAKLLVPARAYDRSVMGTAFDYMLRFTLEKLLSFAVTDPWIAQRALASLSSESGLSWTSAGKGIQPKLEIAAFMAGMVASARIEHERFMSTGRVTSSLLESALQLARCDVYYRIGRLGENFWERPDKEEVAELRALVTAIDYQRLSATEVCLLNPRFGRGSTILGGADADLLLDDCLIDVKTTERLQVRAEDWRQLLGYAALNEHFPIGGREARPIRSLGIYFSRYGYLAKWPIRHIVDPLKFSRFALLLAKYCTAQHLKCLDFESKQQKIIQRKYQADLKHFDDEYRKSGKQKRSQKAGITSRNTRRERARRKYRPKLIRWLIIAEAPPNASDRFFYYENVASQDWLFLSLMRALYEDIAKLDVQDIRDNKKELLRRFQSDGFYVVDSCEVPIVPNKTKGPQIRKQIPKLKRTLDLLRKDGCLAAGTGILLVSAAVHQECFAALRKAGFDVLNSETIPFPSHGHQTKFSEKLKAFVKLR